jgi:hypothetical protein
LVAIEKLSEVRLIDVGSIIRICCV